jgi:hypothetical protein
MANKKQDLLVMGTVVPVLQTNQEDYISLTGIAQYRDVERSDYIVQNWLRNRSTIDFIGLWEQLNNPDFNSIEFDGIKNQAGTNSFSLTPKRWIEATHAIGIISKTGRYGGGTYAHKDIAFEFATWISAEFKLYLIKEFQRLKKDENGHLNLDWNLQRTLSKINYRIHTDAIKEILIPPTVSKEQSATIYANEADLLNVAMFGSTAKQWHERNPEKEGNIRDNASLEQLVILSNLESNNALLIRDGRTQAERLNILNGTAIQQMKSLLKSAAIKQLPGK